MLDLFPAVFEHDAAGEGGSVSDVRVVARAGKGVMQCAGQGQAGVQAEAVQFGFEDGPGAAHPVLEAVLIAEGSGDGVRGAGDPFGSPVVAASDGLLERVPQIEDVIGVRQWRVIFNAVCWIDRD